MSMVRSDRRLTVLFAIASIVVACGPGLDSVASGSLPPPTASSEAVSASAAPPFAEPGPVGTFAVAIVRDDVEDVASEHEICENIGTFQLTIDPDGTWTLHQEPADGCAQLIDPNGDGTWIADGDRITFTDSAAFGCSADFGFRWALQAGALAFSDAADDCGPRVAIFTAHAWRPAP